MNILIIDWFNLIKRYTYLLDDTPIEDGEFYEDITSRIINKVMKTVNEYHVDLLIVCSDLGYNHRANSLLSGEYKANRNRAKSLTQEEQLLAIRYVFLVLPDETRDVLETILRFLLDVSIRSGNSQGEKKTN